MKRNNLFSRILGWCPGFQAAAGFQERPLSSKLEGLSLLVIAWLAGLWLALNMAKGLRGMDLTLFTNRATLMLLLGSLAIMLYAWRNFKPKAMNLEEFPIRPTSIDDLPDVPLPDAPTWGISSNDFTPMAVDPLWGGKRYKVVGLRGISIDWYRDRIKHFKRLKKEKSKRDESS
ncbi:MAG: hypothetical protein ABIJ47_11670 [Candidatus Bathyarchaeota archaeon]